MVEEKSEFMNSMMKAFDLVPAIKVINDCDNLIALTSLRKVLNKRIKEIRKLKGKG